MLLQRCVSFETGRVKYDQFGEDIICGDDSHCGNEEGAPPEFFCGKRTVNPNYDVTNFDNILWAMLLVFQCITLEGWSDIMVMYQKVYYDVVYLYFLPLVFIGAFFLLNLTLAVINSKYSETMENIKAQEAKAEREANLLSNAKLAGGDGDDEVDIDNLENEDENSALKGIGVYEFYIAKRAVKKLMAFKKKWLEEKALKQKQE